MRLLKRGCTATATVPTVQVIAQGRPVVTKLLRTRLRGLAKVVVTVGQTSCITSSYGSLLASVASGPIALPGAARVVSLLVVGSAIAAARASRTGAKRSRDQAVAFVLSARSGTSHGAYFGQLITVGRGVAGATSLRSPVEDPSAENAGVALSPSGSAQVVGLRVRVDFARLAPSGRVACAVRDVGVNARDRVIRFSHKAVVGTSVAVGVAVLVIALNSPAMRGPRRSGRPSISIGEVAYAVTATRRSAIRSRPER